MSGNASFKQLRSIHARSPFIAWAMLLIRFMAHSKSTELGAIS
ncbi:hypothetical protein PSEUDO8BK_190002 [Pseudomonas sp. 8BK]|nr:hypothetical protein PSEUDO8BK_190002 [Pseudomonas sp. 8BK]